MSSNRFDPCVLHRCEFLQSAVVTGVGLFIWQSRLFRLRVGQFPKPAFPRFLAERFSAKLLSVALLCLLAATAEFPATASTTDLTGRWLHEETTPDGNTTQIVIVLQQTGSQLNGKIIFSWGELRISKDSTDGKTFHFDLMTPADDKNPAKYEGTIQGDELQVISRWPGDNNTQYTAKRTSNKMGDPPARIELPALHPVPYNGLAATPPMGWNSTTISKAGSTTR